MVRSYMDTRTTVAARGESIPVNTTAQYDFLVRIITDQVKLCLSLIIKFIKTSVCSLQFLCLQLELIEMRP